MSNTPNRCRYIDLRNQHRGKYLSLDLTRHLPRRVSIGAVLVVTDNPQIFLKVIRKRWMRVVREVARQRSSTLDPTKKHELGLELAHMNAYIFSAALQKHIAANVYFISPEQIDSHMPQYFTVYLSTHVSPTQFKSVITQLPVGGLMVLYSDWLESYERVLKELC